MSENHEHEKDYRSRLLEDPSYLLESVKGDFIMDITESICEIMAEKNISRQELAVRMGKTRGYISQLLNGNRNMTLGTLAEISHFLDHKPIVNFEKTGRKGRVIEDLAVDLEDECEYVMMVGHDE